jgi:hypothetical protein
MPHCQNRDKIKQTILGRVKYDAPNTQIHDRSLPVFVIA